MISSLLKTPKEPCHEGDIFGWAGEQGWHGHSDVNPDYGNGQNHHKMILGGCREGKLA